MIRSKREMATWMEPTDLMLTAAAVEYLLQGWSKRLVPGSVFGRLKYCAAMPLGRGRYNVCVIADWPSLY